MKKTDAERLKDMIDSFPEEFGLRAFRGSTFRVSRQSSYVGDSASIHHVRPLVLYTERLDYHTGTWNAFGKGSPEELQKEIVTDRDAYLFACPDGEACTDPKCVAENARRRTTQMHKAIDKTAKKAAAKRPNLKQKWDGLNGAQVIAHDTSNGTTYIRLPAQLQRPTDGCVCTYCKAHPERTPTWDTLAIPKGVPGTAWTVHMPDPKAFRDSLELLREHDAAIAKRKGGE